MAKPAILTVDDEPAVSQAITRDLRRHYGAEYQIVRTASGSEVLTVLGLCSARPARRLDRLRSTDAGDDRRRATGTVSPACAPLLDRSCNR
jgi:hypothetical protein